MISLIVDVLFSLFDSGLLYYTYFVVIVYLILIVLGVLEMYEYKNKTKFINHLQLITSPFTPSISVIAPAYNEEHTIRENIQSLLALYYNDFEVIIVNDGSTDNTLQTIIDNFELEKTDFYIDYVIPCNEIRGVYKSRLKALVNLTVIDKVNGGKADALNAGINISKKDLISCIDVDCILESDCLLKMVKPFLDKGDPVIATGGVIRIANDCDVLYGRIMKTKLPKKYPARFQVNEYLRAFLIGRMAWSHVNGLMLVSGALGVFDRKIVLEVGGYNTKTVGEDMELIVRMRKKLFETNRKGRVVYVPEPLCWTEAPSTYKVLGKQRNRWTRGSIETLISHSNFFFNRKYGILGMVSYPIWLIVEWLAPFMETIGIIYLVCLFALGYLSLLKISILLVFIVLFSLFVTSTAILLEERGYPIYKKSSDLYKLILLSLLEPFIYHPMTIYWSLRGNIDYLRGKKSWDTGIRKGFANSNKN